MARFVILTHDWPSPHWDFLVEAGGVLRAWRLFAEPCPDVDIAAEPTADHRLFYLDYEGPVSGERGSVSRWDSGSCNWLADEANRVEIVLVGVRLTGKAVIERVVEGWRFRLTVSQPA